MKTHFRILRAAALAAALLFLTACQSKGLRTVTVAQSGTADVIGNDNLALQKAADMLRGTGGTLVIGPGTYLMNDSLFVPSGVTVKGEAGKTILKKSAGVESLLAEDGDYGETMLFVEQPEKFRPGMGVTVGDDKLSSGWDLSVSSVAAVEGKMLRLNPMTVRDYDREHQHARIRNTFPILVTMDAENVVFENLTVDGNKAQNAYLDGCRGGAIYMYRVRNVAVRHCVAHDYNGDGISFQISDRVQVTDSESYGHAGFGVHPGTGSANPEVRNCSMHDNGDVGLFLCWRVRHGRFTGNRMEANGHYGISIGHKDTDNIFENNVIARNGHSGVYFRQETFANSGHRNTFRSNKILDNGGAREGYGFYVAPCATDLVIENNQIAETRTANRTQRYGIFKLAGAGTVTSRNNSMQGHEADFREAAAARK